MQIRPDEPFQMPSRKHPGDAGLDLYTSRYIQVYPNLSAKVATNVAVELPPGTFGLIVPRSSTLPGHGLHVALGVIDAGYRGELVVSVHNLGDSAVPLAPGDRIAQLLILPLIVPETVYLVQSLSESPRGSKGLGSTGR